MKEASRVQAVIEILEDVLKDKTPADLIIDKYFKERRYIGAKDRRFIADAVWAIIRNRMKYSFFVNGNVTARLLCAYHFISDDVELLFNGEQYAPNTLTQQEKMVLEKSTNYDKFDDYIYHECPLWLFDKIGDTKLIEALNTTAPVDVRTNLTSRDAAQKRLRKEGLFFSPTPYSPVGLRSSDRVNLNNCMTYQDGEIEVMDEASQVISLLCKVKPHHKIIDYCAGAGGKSLCIGAELHNEGTVWAHDISSERLSRIKKRAERLDITNIKLINDVIDTDYNRFIIDAPCSGSGTWRRSPDAKYRLTPEKLCDICKTQAEILEFGAKHTAWGGRLIYITCSIFEEENEQQIERFLKAHSEFKPVNHKELWQETLDINLYPFKSEKWLNFSPLNTKTDGFFMCVMKKDKV